MCVLFPKHLLSCMRAAMHARSSARGCLPLTLPAPLLPMRVCACVHSHPLFRAFACLSSNVPFNPLLSLTLDPCRHTQSMRPRCRCFLLTTLAVKKKAKSEAVFSWSALAATSAKEAQVSQRHPPHSATAACRSMLHTTICSPLLEHTVQDSSSATTNLFISDYKPLRQPLLISSSTSEY